MIEKEYEKLKKKYNLPHYKDFNKEFEIQALEIERCGIFYKALLKVILTKISSFLGALDPVASPNPQSIHSIVELSYLNDQDKQEIFSLYKKLFYLYHKGLEFELKGEKEIMNFIKEVWKDWKILKKEQENILKKLTLAWSKDVN